VRFRRRFTHHHRHRRRLVANLFRVFHARVFEPTVTRIGAGVPGAATVATGASMQLGRNPGAKRWRWRAVGRHLLPLMAWGLGARDAALSPADHHVAGFFAPAHRVQRLRAGRHVDYNGGYVAGLVALSTILEVSQPAVCAGR
jgi:hypothetical protein